MASKTIKKAKTSKARTSKARTKTKAKAKTKAISKAKSLRASTKKVAKATSVRAKRKKTVRASARKKPLKGLFTGAGAKLAGKVGSVLPATKAKSSRAARNKVAPLSAGELDEFRELLLRRRRELLGNVARMRAETLDKNRQDAAGNLSKFPTNPADLGSDNFELEFTLGLLESEQDLLKEIDQALQRIAQGVYGICEGTGQPITRDRLAMEPWARYTVDYARLKENGLASEESDVEEQ